MKRVLCLGAMSLAVLTALGFGVGAIERTVNAQGSAPAKQGRAAAPATSPAATPAGRSAAAGAAPAAAGVPNYRVSPLWPKPLPNHWVFGSISGVAVDARDHVWVVHRGADSLESAEKGMMLTPQTSSVCCIAAPSVLEFDQAGTVLSSWGGPGLGFAWPQSTGGMAVDGKGSVWITAYGLDVAPAAAGRGAAPAPAAAAPGGAAPAGGRGGRGGAPAAGGAAPGAAAPATAAAPQDGAAPAGRGRGAAAAPAGPVTVDAHVTKYSSVGTMLLQIGKPGEPGNPDSTTLLNRPAGIAVDDAANEVYIADSGNHRIIVFDSNTGAFKRQWGGSGEKATAAGAGPYDPNAPVARQFRDPTCVKIAKDGMVYVCDRMSNRIQVFQKTGTFVKEMIIEKDTRGAVATIGQAPGMVLNSAGSVWDVAFSNDAAQRYLFVADGHNDRLLTLRRDTLAQVGIIGGGGRQAGRFLAPGSVAVDSRGTLYTGEQHHAKRVQKFVPAAAAAAAAR